ncbi:zinc finger matrin-type protein 4 [Mesoplodon densirostris]|uniref:zinc finger matrin-type protein 4 n=1 Tax=Mesoplodon densirostris TaxID=48708 RepID=UPI0028DC67BA|nr:zinc finger matrin-type protein 4 [Mesoplodon densirostris]
MKSSDIDQDLFTDSYCKVCSAQLISESQRVAHYESRKHASKVRLYYMLHPRDGGCPAKRLRSENGSDADMVDKNKCCTLCNMSFTSAVVADSHYQGKIHAKRLKLLLGEKTPLTTTATPLNSLKPPRVDTAPVVSSPYQRRDSDRYCGLCAAWFNNPLMAQQHYDGKKHKKNAARVALLEQLGTTLDTGELRGLRRNYRCTICSVSLNSIEQYHAHLKGSKHQTKDILLKSGDRVAHVVWGVDELGGCSAGCWKEKWIESGEEPGQARIREHQLEPVRMDGTPCYCSLVITTHLGEGCILQENQVWTCVNRRSADLQV